MLSQAQLRQSKGNKPSAVPIKVKVCSESGIAKYQVDSGDKKEYKRYSALLTKPWP